MRADLPPEVRGVEFGVGVGGVPVPGPPGAEHHVASLDRALVHLAEVDSTEVDLEGALVAEGLEADGTLDSPLT